MADTRLPLHSEIPIQYTWNATSVFESSAAWTAEFKAVSDQLSDAARFQGQLAASAATLP